MCLSRGPVQHSKSLAMASGEPVRIPVGATTGRVRIDSVTSLWRAAEHGDLARLKMLLDAGHDVNALCEEKAAWKRDTRHRSPLSAAVDGNEPLAVRLLLRRGANPNLQDGDGDRFPLHWASSNGDHEECAQLLVQAGASVDVRDANGHTPLEFARGSADGSVHGFARFGSSLLGRPAGRERVIGVLEHARAHPDRAPWSAERARKVLTSSFWKAAAAGDSETLERCLTQHAQPVDMPRPKAVARLSALAIACYHGHKETATFLLSRHANPNLREQEGGFSPLFFCAHNADHHDIALLLLEAGADPEQVKHDGEPPADFARRQGREGTSALLATAAERQRTCRVLEEALAREEAWLAPSPAALMEAAEAAQRAGVDAVLVDRGRAASQRLHAKSSTSAAAAAGSWAQHTFGQLFSSVTRITSVASLSAQAVLPSAGGGSLPPVSEASRAMDDGVEPSIESSFAANKNSVTVQAVASSEGEDVIALEGEVLPHAATTCRGSPGDAAASSVSPAAEPEAVAELV
jgi:ankyrin repeat protein